MPNILQVVETLRRDDPLLDRREFAEFNWINWGGLPRIVPSEALVSRGRNASYFYRGQTKRHRPCYASLMRGAPLNPEAPTRGSTEAKFRFRFQLSRVRIAEFQDLLRDHPLTTLAAKHGLLPDYEALGQHYGMQTDLLDLTSSIEVAAFFAVSNWHVDRFIPATIGCGVMYRVHWHRVRDAWKYFDCVGHGPATRPGIQHAWSFRLRRGVDFEAVPVVEAIDFEHDRECSLQIMALFDNGNRIYPKESLVNIARKLVDLPFVTMHGIRSAIAKDINDPAKVDEIAELVAVGLNHELGKEIVDGYDLELELEDVETGKAEAERLEHTLLNNVGFRLIGEEKSSGAE